MPYWIAVIRPICNSQAEQLTALLERNFRFRSKPCVSGCSASTFKEDTRMRRRVVAAFPIVQQLSSAARASGTAYDPLARETAAARVLPREIPSLRTTRRRARGL